MRMRAEDEDIQRCSRCCHGPRPLCRTDVCSSPPHGGYRGTLGTPVLPVLRGFQWLTTVRLAVARDDEDPCGLRTPPALNQRIPRPSILKRPALSCFEASLAGMRVDGLWARPRNGTVSAGRTLMRRDGYS